MQKKSKDKVEQPKDDIHELEREIEKQKRRKKNILMTNAANKEEMHRIHLTKVLRKKNEQTVVEQHSDDGKKHKLVTD